MASKTSSAPQLRSIVAEVVLALAIGAFAYWISCLLVWPEAVAKGFGEHWEKVSLDPFGFPGDLPHRFLSPFLSWLCGFRGPPHYVLFTRGLVVLFLATIFFFCRQRRSSLVDATLITLSVAVISPVQMYKLHWVGYPDALTYALFFGMLLAARRPVVFWTLFLCNLLNHELAAFLLPWSWFVRRQQDDRWRTDAVVGSVALGLYVAFYYYVKAVAPGQVYSDDYFRQNPLFPGGSFVVLMLVVAHWTVAFGPVLAVLAWHQHARPRERERLHLWWVLAGMGAIFCIAFDWNRHCHLIVLPMVLAAIRFLQEGHRLAYLVLVLLGVVLMQIWSPWPSVSWPTVALTEPEPDFLVKAGVIVAVPQGIGFGPLSAATGNWLPRVWPTLLSLAGILAAIWGVGAIFARFTRGADRPTAVPVA